MLFDWYLLTGFIHFEPPIKFLTFVLSDNFVIFFNPEYFALESMET